MSQWHLSYDGKQIGPMTLEEAIRHASQNPNGHAWREGYPEWVPIKRVQELSGGGQKSVKPPTFSQSDDIEYRIMGSEMQFVELELDPGESCIAEAGALMYKDPAISMSAVFGDGSSSGGLMDKLFSAGKRLVTGENLFMTLFTHNGGGKGKIAFAAPYPGNIIPVALKNMGGALICQKDSFLCAARGVSIGIYFQKKILTGLFGGEGFIMQKLEGDGYAFVHAGGTLVERTLAAGETLHVDTGCLVAMEPSVTFEIENAGNIKTMIFGGEGFFFAALHGPGNVWLQSLPFSRLAGRIVATAPVSREEGSVLGQLGKLVQGDRSI